MSSRGDRQKVAQGMMKINPWEEHFLIPKFVSARLGVPRHSLLAERTAGYPELNFQMAVEAPSVHLDCGIIAEPQSALCTFLPSS